MINKQSSAKKGSNTSKRNSKKLTFQKIIQGLKPKHILESATFISFGILIILISFLGQKNKGQNIILKEQAKERIVADFSFEYESTLSADKIAKKIRSKTPPIYIKSENAFNEFDAFVESIKNAYAKNKISKKDSENAESLVNLEAHLKTLIEAQAFDIESESIIKLFKETSPKDRAKLLNEGLQALQELYVDGIYNKTLTNNPNSGTIFLQIRESDVQKSGAEAKPLEDALISLKVSINALSKNEAISELLFNLFKNGLQPNLIFSEEETNQAIEQSIKDIAPQIIVHEQGDTLIAPGQTIGQFEMEKFKAYKAKDLELKGDSMVFNSLFIGRLLLTSIFLITLLLFIRYSLKSETDKKTILSVSAVAIVLNLIIFRIIIESGQSLFFNSEPLIALIPNLMPIALAPMLTAVLVGSVPGILTALLISVLFSLGFDNSIEQMLITFLPGVVGVYASFKIRSRSKLLRAGLLSGIASALGYIIVSLLNEASPTLISQQIICSTIIGLITGITAVGLLPILEQVFKITTSITLLELTDFNHPLLRKMQFEAPGTYHHSLMVANLSENAADAIGSNPLLCRVCCLFHDIGKLVKPEYFAENQRGINPHDERNPSMSALVIKAHVKEGVEIAKQEGLPKVIIDIIKQHHGTSLIKYFYHQSKKQKSIEENGNSSQYQNTPSDDSIYESTYRYDGPKPRFKESAIIFFADAVEAASRSLKKVTQPAIEELIDGIFDSRIKDGQLDECPLTFKELHEIKTSFTRTLLNMLHTRIEYPKDSEIESEA